MVTGVSRRKSFGPGTTSGYCNYNNNYYFFFGVRIITI